MGNTVIVDTTGSVMTITLNRPQSFNAMNIELLDDLLVAVSAGRVDRSIRSVILTGTGRVFSAGGDIQLLAGRNGQKSEIFNILTQKLHRLIMDIRQIPKPVVAAINGVASGAGFSLAMACDLRLASVDAKFKQAYTSIGLSPDGGWTISVARQIGMAKTAELLLLDPTLKAEEALNLGLVNRVVPTADLLEEAMKLAQLVSSKSLTAFSKAKKLINQSLGFGLVDQLEAERCEIMSAGENNDFNEGITAFLEKRQPNFEEIVF